MEALTKPGPLFLYGSSCNPPTGKGGHQSIVKTLAELGSVLILPVYQHVYPEKRGLAPFEDRFTMARYCFETVAPCVVVSDLERTVKMNAVKKAEQTGIDARELKVGTYDLLMFAKTKYPDRVLHWVMGADTFEDLRDGKWTTKLENILEICSVLVVPRKGVMLQLPLPDKCDLLKVNDATSISSTQVRDSFAKGRDPEGVAPTVLDYIKQRGLYGAQPLPAAALGLDDTGREVRVIDRSEKSSARRDSDLQDFARPDSAEMDSVTPKRVHMVFDTETTGIHCDSQVIALAWMIINNDGTEVERYHSLWRLSPEHKWSPEAEKVHGISRERLDAEGQSPSGELRAFYRKVEEVQSSGGYIVAHNLKFDEERINATAIANKFEPLWPGSLRRLCTLVTVRKSNWGCGGKCKWEDGSRGGCSKNSNAFGHLFNRKAIDILGGRLHDAMTDVQITACLFRRIVLRIQSNAVALGGVQNIESHEDTKDAGTILPA